MTQQMARRASIPLRATKDAHGVTFEVRLDELPPPSETYYADWFEASVIAQRCSFRFGKSFAAGRDLRTLLEIVMSPGDVRQLRTSFETEFLGRLRTFLTNSGYSAHVNPPGGPLTSQTKEHTLVATLATAGHHEMDASICFYRVSPMLFAQINRGKTPDSLDVEPVVRVDTSTPLLLRFAESIVELGSTIEPTQP